MNINLNYENVFFANLPRVVHNELSKHVWTTTTYVRIYIHLRSLTKVEDPVSQTPHFQFSWNEKNNNGLIHPICYPTWYHSNSSS